MPWMVRVVSKLITSRIVSSFGRTCLNAGYASSVRTAIRWTILTCAQKLTSSQLNLPHGTKQKRIMKKLKTTRMWANAQRDGRPAKYSWRPLFNAAKFGWHPLLECRAVTKPRRETRWNLLGCPKQPKRSRPLVGQSSPYCEDMWGRYCCLTIFSDCLYVL